ncbi:hypothetical protein [Marinomonas sp. 2405UD68-3]|uniref:hypothetical protein n=1 Tax=Marinomonas sp. 2405UD68-3 TaxID=3391835 RepID=UPI0039C8E6BF
MNFEKYSEALTRFELGVFPSIRENYQAICESQDHLIADICQQGAQIAGWKIVEDSGVVILSPIFDFQVFSPNSTQIRQRDISGIEMELCFPFYVPTTDEAFETDAALDAAIENQSPHSSIEMLRPQINPNSYLACDFYFNYGIIVSEQPVEGSFTLKVGNGSTEYDFTLRDNDLCSEKRALLKSGVLECMRRDYTGKEYFFMTGSLNGLIPTEICVGENLVVDKQEKRLSFHVE